MTVSDLLGKYQAMPALIEPGAAGGDIWVSSLDHGTRHVVVQFGPGPDDKVIRATEMK